jgi:hypothetical protein
MCALIYDLMALGRKKIEEMSFEFKTSVVRANGNARHHPEV